MGDNGQMDGGEDPVRRLAQWIRKRRIELGLSQRTAADRAGIARNTWIAAEDGARRVYDENYAKIERALQWLPGSIGLILEGGDPHIELWPAPASASPNEADDLARIAALPIPASRKLEMVRVYLEIASQAQAERDEDEREAG